MSARISLRSRFHLAAAVTAGSAALLICAVPASAQIQSLSLFKTHYENQTGPATTALIEYAWDGRLFVSNPDDATAVTLTYPGPASPLSIPLSTYSNVVFDTGNVNFGSQAAMDAAFPTGTYMADWSGGAAGAGSASVDYAADAYSADQPMFTPTTFTGLSSENAADAITLNWNNNVVSPAGTDDFLFLNVFDATTSADVFSENFFSASTTSATIAAGTLLPGMSYLVTLDFSNRISGTSGPVGTTLGFDRVTEATLDTLPASAPEPGAFGLAASALPICLSGLWVGRRGRRRG